MSGPSQISENNSPSAKRQSEQPAQSTSPQREQPIEDSPAEEFVPANESLAEDLSVNTKSNPAEEEEELVFAPLTSTLPPSDYESDDSLYRNPTPPPRRSAPLSAPLTLEPAATTAHNNVELMDFQPTTPADEDDHENARLSHNLAADEGENLEAVDPMDSQDATPPPQAPQTPQARTPKAPRWPESKQAPAISPTKRVVAGGRGNIGLRLYKYPPTSSGREFIYEFLRRHEKNTITMSWLQEFQQHLYNIKHAGYLLGPSIAFIAIDGADWRSDVAINQTYPLDIVDGFQTVGAFFRLHSDSVRKFFDSDVEALLLFYSNARMYMGDINNADSISYKASCGRCSSTSHTKYHIECMQVYYNGKLLKGGVCTNCIKAGDHEACSFRRTSVVRRGVQASGIAGPLRPERLLEWDSERPHTRSAAGKSLAKATKPKDPQMSFAWTSRSNATKYGKHLVDIHKDRESNFNPLRDHIAAQEGTQAVETATTATGTDDQLAAQPATLTGSPTKRTLRSRTLLPPPQLEPVKRSLPSHEAAHSPADVSAVENEADGGSADGSAPMVISSGDESSSTD